MPAKNLYQLLHVDPSAEPDVIAAAHAVLTSKLRDETDGPADVEARLRELDDAFAVLMDPGQRRAYDARLGADSLAPVRMGSSRGTYTILDHVRSAGRDRDGAGDRAAQDGHAATPARGQDGRDARAASESARNTRLDFGRYQGWTLGDLLRADPTYLRWLARHSSGVRYRGAILRLLAEQEGVTPLRVFR